MGVDNEALVIDLRYYEWWSCGRKYYLRKEISALNAHSVIQIQSAHNMCSVHIIANMAMEQEVCLPFMCFFRIHFRSLGFTFVLYRSRKQLEIMERPNS